MPPDDGLGMAQHSAPGVDSSLRGPLSWLWLRLLLPLLRMLLPLLPLPRFSGLLAGLGCLRSTEATRALRGASQCGALSVPTPDGIGAVAFGPPAPGAAAIAGRALQCLSL
jgi:hypothetical protein